LATGLTTRLVALDAAADHPLHQRVAERMATPVDTRCPTLDGLLNEFADVDAAVTMRYHGAVAAVLGGAPVVPLAFSPKLAAIAEDLGSAAVFIENLNDLPVAVNKALADSRHLPDAVGRLTELAGRNVTVIEDLLGAL
jgi:polysaccharide pyruvyl transferase WcaK-like protein